MGADRQQDRVGFDGLLGSVGAGNLDGAVVHQAAFANDDAHAGTFEGGADIAGLLLGKGQQPVVDHRKVGYCRIQSVHVDAEGLRVLDAAHRVRGGDQGLRRHNVGQHG